MPRVRSRDGFLVFFRYLEETGLKTKIRRIADTRGVTIYDVYWDEKTVAARAARIEAWWYLVAETYRSPAQVAALFDWSHGAVVRALRRLREVAEERTVVVARDTVTILAGIAASPDDGEGFAP